MSTESIRSAPPSAPMPVAAPRLSLVRSQPLRTETADEGATGNESDQLSQAVAELNRYVAGSRTDLRFTVDREAGEVVVSIVDSETGQVLRQMPSPEALRIARYIEHDRLGLVRQRA